MKTFIYLLLLLLCLCHAAHAKGNMSEADFEFLDYVSKYASTYEKFIRADKIFSETTLNCCDGDCGGLSEWRVDRCHDVATAKSTALVGDTPDGYGKTLKKIGGYLKEMLNEKRVSAGALKKAKRVLDMADACEWSETSVQICK